MTISPEIQSWVIIPILIFVARMCDVSLATVRNIFISKGFRKIVPFIGFFEVLIWLIAMKQVMSYAENWLSYVAWAAGFSMGTVVGMRIEERLALGTQVLRIITNQDSQVLVQALRDARHGVTTVDAQGGFGPVKMIFTVVQRKNVKDVIAMIELHCPSAFYSIEDVRTSEHGYFSQPNRPMDVINRLFSINKGK